MIVRLWKGICKKASEEAYIEHLQKDTLPKLRELKGFREMEILKRSTDHGTEFLVKTSWDALENIEAFSGDDIKVAVVPQNVQEMMLLFNDFVEHYSVVGR